VNKWKIRIKIINALIKKELKLTTHGVGLYFVVFSLFLISIFVLRNYINSIQIEGITVYSNPLYYPLYLSVLVGSMYLALTSVITISHEREEGTLKTLFIGPVDSFSYLIGKYIHQLFVFSIILAFVLLYLVIASLLTNFIFNYKLIATTFMASLAGSTVIAFGILFSVITNKSKTSIVLLITVSLFFLALQSGYFFLKALNQEEVSSIVVLVYKIIYQLNSFFAWVSPFSYLSRAVRTVELNNLTVYIKNILYLIIYNIIFLSLAVLIFERKGVR